MTSHKKPRFTIRAPSGPGLNADAHPTTGRTWAAAARYDRWIGVTVEGVTTFVRVGKAPDGRYVVTAVLLGEPDGSRAITSTDLHQVALGEVYDAIAEVSQTYDIDRHVQEFTGDPRRRGGRPTGGAAFQEAADLYRACVVERPNAVIQCVADRLGVSHSTASRRVARARDLGLLEG